MFENNMTRIVVVTVVIGIMAWLAFPLSKVRLGLDLRGGVHMEARIDMDELKRKLGETRLSEAQRNLHLDQAIAIIRERINSSGTLEAEVRKSGNDRIVLQIPGDFSKEKAEKMLTQVGYLEFALVSEDKAKLDLAMRGKKIRGYRFLTMMSGRKGEQITQNLLVKEKPEFDGTYLESSRVNFGQQFNEPQVELNLNSKGAKLFAHVTRMNVDKRLAIILDNTIVSAPLIKSEIPGGRAVISGNFSVDEAKSLSTVLNAGALPAKIEPLSSRYVSASLGKDSIHSGLLASLAGLIVVAIFMVIYYLKAGVLATIALALNIICIIGAVVFRSVTLTLPGIAGLILTMGMAVDANVLIFERIREEISRGKRLKSAIKAGYERAFTTIIDANLTTMITSAILYFFGRGPVKGFAVVLIIGIIASMFTALFVTRTVFNFLLEMGWLNELKMLSLIKKPNLQFIQKRKKAYVFSAILILISIGAFIAKGETKYGIDFTGGGVLELQFEKDVEIDEIRGALKKANLDVSMQYLEGNQNLLIRSKGEDTTQIKTILKSGSFPAFKETRSEEVGPVVGKELKASSLKAIFLSLLGIILYIKIRFMEMRFSLAAVAALVHDVIITVGFYCLLGFEMNVPTVAAVLTIVGYSLNDTIVIFDRIRESLSGRSKKSQIDLITEAINSTLSRTLLTSFTTLLVITSILIYGGGMIRDFAVTLFIGVLIGTYSSVFVASPILVEMENQKNAGGSKK